MVSCEKGFPVIVIDGNDIDVDNKNERDVVAVNFLYILFLYCILFLTGVFFLCIFDSFKSGNENAIFHTPGTDCFLFV